MGEGATPRRSPRINKSTTTHSTTTTRPSTPTLTPTPTTVPASPSPTTKKKLHDQLARELFPDSDSEEEEVNAPNLDKDGESESEAETVLVEDSEDERLKKESFRDSIGIVSGRGDSNDDEEEDEEIQLARIRALRISSVPISFFLLYLLPY